MIIKQESSGCHQEGKGTKIETNESDIIAKRITHVKPPKYVKSLFVNNAYRVSTTVSPAVSAAATMTEEAV